MDDEYYKLLKVLSLYLLFSIFFTSLFIFIGFFLDIAIGHYTLLISFIIFNLIWFLIVFKFKYSQENIVISCASLLIVAILFLVSISLFSHTYDTSYDGESYHQTAVIELASKWDPIYQRTLPVKTIDAFDKSLVQGNPKIFWSIDASIYKLTHSINTATTINLLIGLVAGIFAFFALLSFGLEEQYAFILAVLAVLSVTYIDQLLSFREDGLSYGLFIIGISSLILSIKERYKTPYIMSLFASIILLIGTKFSNAYFLFPLVVVAIYLVYKYRLYRLKQFKVLVVLSIISSFLVLFNPYITNFINYHSIDYPYNQKSISEYVNKDNTPLNIRNDNFIEKFFYGVFSRPDIESAFNNSGNAKLRYPLVFSANDFVNESDTAAKLVGGYGLIFSGAFIISLSAIVYLIVIKKSKKEIIYLKYLLVLTLLILVACLITINPNYARYSSELNILPIIIITVLLLFEKIKQRNLNRLFIKVLLILVILNVFIELIASSTYDVNMFHDINQQLAELKSSHKTYLANTSIYYSNFIRLEQYGIKIKISSVPVNCNNKITLINSRQSTFLCELR